MSGSRFELGPPVQADIGQRVDHCSEVDLAFAQVVRVVLQVALADAHGGYDDHGKCPLPEERERVIVQHTELR